MNLEQIKEAIELGMKVYWVNERYRVIKLDSGEYLIACDHGTSSANYSGLTYKDGVTLNGKEKDFYINICEEEEKNYIMQKASHSIQEFIKKYSQYKEILANN